MTKAAKIVEKERKNWHRKDVSGKNDNKEVERTSSRKQGELIKSNKKYAREKGVYNDAFFLLEIILSTFVIFERHAVWG